MLDIISKSLSKVFGTKSDRDVKKLDHFIGLVQTEFALIQSISDDELRNKTAVLKNIIAEESKPIENQIIDLQNQDKDNPEMDLETKEALFKQIDDLELEQNKVLEATLKNILPAAFAVIKETARRFKEQGQLKVKANHWDRELAMKKSNVEIQGDMAIWHNAWEAGGTIIKWEMLHYDVQIIGGVVLHEGKIAEMATGEGKTLVATFPAYLNALAGKGVHIVTVNDYLAKRDSEWMGPLYEFHGLSVDCIDQHQPNSPERRKAYMADITFGTNNEFGFDYLRDNMARDPEDLVQRKHHYAMVDEVDSVLIDDARTPLIISGPVPRGDVHEYHELKPRVQKLVEAQKKITNQFLNEAKKLISDKREKEGGVPLFRSFRGLPKNKALIKYLGETGIKAMMLKTEGIYLQDNSKLMPEADAPLFFTIDEKHNSIELTDKGLDLITNEGEDSKFFILPDVGAEIAEIENNAAFTDEEKIEKKDQLMRDYSEKSSRIHSINQLLKAYTLFEKDTEYIIADGKIKIVDEQTGRVMEGRRYSDGLHQALEAKENVKVEDATQTFATITLQNYFRMYHKLCGMTGTAETEAGEFWDIYKLDVVVIPTNRTIIRSDKEDLVYKTKREKYNAVADEIVSLTKAGRPVLVGTTSVEISELLSRMLKMKAIDHEVLNAKLHQREADIVAKAGKPSAVTIATNMAGRGTDIKLTPEVVKNGGLAIIGTERHESRRVDRQLRGRAGRQGDPGTSQFFVSLEDNLMRLFGSDRIAKLMDRLGLDEGEVIQHSMITKSIERAQRKVEENNFSIRKRLLEYDDVMNSQREIVYKRRRNALYGKRLEIDLLNMLYDTCDDIVQKHHPENDFSNFKLECIRLLSINPKINSEDFQKSKPDQISANIFSDAQTYYKRKNVELISRALPVMQDIHKSRGATITNVVVPFTDKIKQLAAVVNLEESIETSGKNIVTCIEKSVTLSLIDDSWKDHLREMDDLKQSVQNAVYEQKDPLLVYKFESFNLFKSMIAEVNESTISFLYKGTIPINDPDEVHEAQKRKASPDKLKLQKDDAQPYYQPGSPPSGPRPPQEKPPPAKSSRVAGRNDKVTVQYTNGIIKKNVKYKTIENDILNNNCVLLNE